jgi:carbon-monoxide dehydrogenase medium subunit
MTRQTDVLATTELSSRTPLLARATAHIGHVQIRNRGTVGGSLCHGDGAAELPAVALTVGASLEAASIRGIRTIPAAEFFVGPFATALEDDELLTGISFPEARPRSGFAVEECTRRQGDFALVGAMCALHMDESDRIDDVAVTLFGVGGTAVRAGAAEAALADNTARDVSAEDVGAAAVADLECASDIHATAAYRKKVAALLAGRAVMSAIREALA